MGVAATSRKSARSSSSERGAIVHSAAAGISRAVAGVPDWAPATAVPDTRSENSAASMASRQFLERTSCAATTDGRLSALNMFIVATHRAAMRFAARPGTLTLAL